MKHLSAPLNEAFTGVLEFSGGMYSNRSNWHVVQSDNPAVIAGMRCRTMNSRLETILKGSDKSYTFGISPNGRLFIAGRFKTRKLYGTNLTLPHK